MLNLSTPYLLMSFLLSATTIILGIVLFFLRIPRKENLKPYNLSRYILAFAYLAIGVFNGFKVVESSVFVDLSLVYTLTLISAFFQALLFTFTLLVLIQPVYVTCRKITVQLGLILLISISLLLLFVHVPPCVYPYFYNAVAVLYMCQLTCYTFLFRKKYVQCLKQLKNYYNEDEDHRLRWAKISFYIALFIGIMALGCTYIPLSYCKYCIGIFIIFYIYFAIQYYNYPSKFGYLIAAVSSGARFLTSPQPKIHTAGTVQPLSVKEQQLKEAIGKWVKEKKFQCTDISHAEIAAELGTDKSFLTTFFCNHMKTEFRTWRTQLRIEEAKYLLLAYPDRSVSKIGQQVGISDRSNFQKKFIELVGVSPKEWRKQNIHN